MTYNYCQYQFYSMTRDSQKLLNWGCFVLCLQAFKIWKYFFNVCLIGINLRISPEISWILAVLIVLTNGLIQWNVNYLVSS